MFSRLKEELTSRLTLAQRLAVKRLLVGSVRHVVGVAGYFSRLKDRVIERAIEQGLDIDSARGRRQQSLPPAPAALFGLNDLLFLKDVITNRDAVSAPAGSQIRSSVIVPVFNNADLTFQCLRSLLGEVDLAATEIIVVNDASTDRTPELLAIFSNYIRVINNDKNLGFGDTCNRGAAAANGQYLVFVNNDTWVMPGWLTELELTVERNDAVGAAGSMFLYPDGRVQEAGAIIWRSGHAFHYGWGGSPDDPRLNFAREVDYCSAASLLVRRDLFEQLGGFDPRYSPAYYEDADLCMGVRDLGYKVIYQPASRIIHHEGATAGTELGAGVKSFQVTNHAKFYEKWRETLEQHHLTDNTADPREAADRRRETIMVIDDRVPTPDRDAGSARMSHILNTLSQWCRPLFVSVNTHRWPDYEKQLWRLGVETTSAAEHLRLIPERGVEIVVVSRPDVAEAVIPTLRRRFPTLKIIFDLVDVHFIRLEREFELKKDPQIATEAARYRSVETRMARTADLIWCASTEDQRVMKDLAPETPSVVIPTIHTVRSAGKPFDEREGLLFLGNMLHRPNVDSVHFVMNEIMPLVRRDLPDVTLSIVGSDMPWDIHSYAGDHVRVLGFVPDIEPLLTSSRLMLAPLRFGAGVKGKIGESLAHGLPVVTTPIGAESIGIRHGREAMIGESAEDLATVIVEAYTMRELWQRLADNGRTLIENNFAPAVVGDIISRSIEQFRISQEEQ